jgi:hypothetical protein
MDLPEQIARDNGLATHCRELTPPGEKLATALLTALKDWSGMRLARLIGKCAKDAKTPVRSLAKEARVEGPEWCGRSVDLSQ